MNVIQSKSISRWLGCSAIEFYFINAFSQLEIDVLLKNRRIIVGYESNLYIRAVYYIDMMTDLHIHYATVTTFIEIW